MTKLLYANGDSFVFGMECIEDRATDPENKLLAFPKYLADKLGASTYINNAYNGATNDFIFKNTIIDLKKLENEGHNPEDIFVVIGITSLHRTEFDAYGWVGEGPELENVLETMKKEKFVGYPEVFEKNKTFFVNPTFHLDLKIRGRYYSIQDDIVTFCARYLWTDNVQLKSQEARLIALHDILTLKGYRHLFVNTVHPLPKVETLDITDKNFYKIDTDTFWSYGALTFPNEHRMHNHFSTVPHKAYADLLFEHIQKYNV